MSVRNAFNHLAKNRSEVVKAAAIEKCLGEVAEDFKAHMPSKELIVDNQRLTRHELSKQLGVEIDLIRNRTPRDGQVEVAKERLVKEKCPVNHRVEINGERLSLPELAECYHLSVKRSTAAGNEESGALN